MGHEKTNAMRILASKNIVYTIHTYESKDGKIDGVSVAHKIGIDPARVYKTLVAQGNSNNYYVFIIPVSAELDLKKAAKASGEKRIDMIPAKDILKTTGYMRGGCSPIGMKKKFQTFVDESVLAIGSIVVSGGKIGVQMELAVEDLILATQAKTAPIVRP